MSKRSHLRSWTSSGYARDNDFQNNDFLGDAVTSGRPTRVLFDATSVPGDRGGVGRYVDGLLGALSSSDVDLAVVCQRTDAERYGRVVPRARIVAAPAAVAHRPARLAWEQTGLPMLSQQLAVQVVHSPFYTCPLRSGCPVTVTVHDATFFTEPEHYDKSRRTFFRSAIKTSMRRASRVIVPSKATRDELIRILDADPTRIDVAYHGVDQAAFHAPSDDEKARVRARLGLGACDYVAFLGAKEPRKNVPNLIRGWARAVRDRADPPALVIAGGQGHDDEIDQAVAELSPRLRLLRPGYLRYADLPGFLGGALVAAYPSYGEGFGLPILEAMACGAPVLTTPRLSLPEVGGDAVAYTGPGPEDIARELGELLDDEARRNALAKAGHDRAKEFTWESSAEAHLATWARVASHGVPAGAAGVSVAAW
jgi:glycosyltransferase involved in cell wall biosynthesis